MAKGDDIQDRMVKSAVRIMRVCSGLPKTRAARHVGDQLLRSGTAPAPLYAEAGSAEGRNDFVHKLKICLKELNESQVWLQIIIESDMLPESKLKDLMVECNQLSRIINSSIKTATAGKSSEEHVDKQSVTADTPTDHPPLTVDHCRSGLASNCQ